VHSVSAPTESAPALDVEEAAHHEEPVHETSGHDAGGPPPPVVPAIRKGAKASLRKKGAR